MNILNKNIKELASLLEKKEISSVELTNTYLDQIKQDNKSDKPLNAFITLLEEKALIDAKRADTLISEKKATTLTGIPLAIKDLLNLKDTPTTCGSKILQNYTANYTATVLRRLIDEQHMIPLGKTNMDEFAMGSSNETSYFGNVRNPHDRDRIPGGSSGGSVAAVSGHLAPVALGSDTGGSIRQPSSFTGCVGLKPTFGRVSRYGMIAFGSSYDQIGPIAKSVEDAALIFNAIAGYDKHDPTTLKEPFKPVSITKSVKGLKIGIIEDHLNAKGVNEEVKLAIEKSAKFLEENGAQIIPIHLYYDHFGIPTYYILACAEASANLERFDGIRYGYRNKESKNLEDLYIQSRSEGFGEEVKRRIMLGTYSLSSEKSHDFYDKALKVRRLIYEDYKKAFQKVDLILGPTAPTTAFKFGEKKDPISMYLSDVFTVGVNHAGLPALSLNVAFDKQKLPIGAHLVANSLEEQTIFNAASVLELMEK